MKPQLRIARVACVALALTLVHPCVVSAQPSVKHSDLIGTWQLMTVKNLKTGAVDSVAKHRLTWMQFTDSRRFYISSELDRTIMVDSQFRKLSADSQAVVNYAKVFNKDGSQRFASNAGFYTLKGNALTYTAEIALNLPKGDVTPYTIVRLNRSTLVYRSMPDAQGVSDEYTARRLK